MVWQLTDRQLDQLIGWGRGWPWNGYELRKTKQESTRLTCLAVTAKTLLK